jgi:hypothetical protein
VRGGSEGEDAAHLGQKMFWGDALLLEPIVLLLLLLLV